MESCSSSIDLPNNPKIEKKKKKKEAPTQLPLHADMQGPWLHHNPFICDGWVNIEIKKP
jgi:hypothetical protein